MAYFFYIAKYPWWLIGSPRGLVNISSFARIGRLLGADLHQEGVSGD
jgi:hypothetical protein